jgi:lipid-A-disaccharide synthase
MTVAKLQRVMMIAGEASGDMHGAGVVRALRARRPGVEITGIGGDRMRAEGMDLTFHCSGLSFMGFSEVVRNLPTVFRVERTLNGLLETRRPDVVVLIDYPGFNLRFARKAKQRGIPVLYYISPQVWAWNPGRVNTMKSVVDRMKVVFPFEVDIYRKAGIDVEFVGHPLVEHISATMTREAFLGRHGLDPARKILGLFPGSRLQELERILPTLVLAAGRLQEELNVQPVLAVAPNLGAESFRPYLGPGTPIRLAEHATYDLMQYADAAVVTSGTATLETGWFGTPMVIVYRTSALSYAIGRMLVDLPYIGLVNIVAGRKVVPELLQSDMTADRVAEEVRPYLEDPSRAEDLRRDLAVVRTKLGTPGASDRVASAVVELGEGA